MMLALSCVISVAFTPHPNLNRVGGPNPWHSSFARAGTPRAVAAVPLRLLAAGAVAAILPSIRIVSTAEVELVEKLGQYNRQLKPGFHLLLPFVERVSFKGTTREQVLDIPPKPAITSDNAPLSVDAVVYWRIIDPVKARYEVNELIVSLQNLVTTQHVHHGIGLMTQLLPSPLGPSARLLCR
uniref:Band 7 domain-containing protein n=1 Tax=Haptolina brevifila TaxID=156173 RepID=A0A7S2GIX0_9EUKA|mmetsp:Transcript_37519/g.75032  ORF Transcript_37519/g.75032 Transcript_37519/m.75032 type:complete len:183 (+) Transcript_37519:76-624(+)